MGSRGAEITIAGAFGLFALLLSMWLPTLQHLIGLWQVPTYFHGFLVPIVSLWLIHDGWRRDEHFTGWPLALLGVAGASLLYLAAGQLDVITLQHIALAGALISLAALVFGRAFAVRHRFALLFLFCAVPMGESLTPLLQELTIGAIINTLDVLRIPAARVGQVIRTEPGDFHVVEACAGLQYLVAMAVTGILLAHLLYLNRSKQLVLMILALTVPILANWVRAITLVLVAVHSDFAFGTGTAHTILSWGMFGAVMAVVFVVAFMTADKDAGGGAPRRPEPAMAPVHRPRPALWLAAGGMVAVAGGLA